MWECLTILTVKHSHVASYIINNEKLLNDASNSFPVELFTFNFLLYQDKWCCLKKMWSKKYVRSKFVFIILWRLVLLIVIKVKIIS